MKLTESILSSLPGDSLGSLRRTDQLWSALKLGTLPIPEVVQTTPQSIGEPEWDVIVCGGTLGILLATALVKQGWRVLLLERGQLRGREQEWNISRRELEVLLQLELLTAEELEQAIVTQYNPARIAFLDGSEVWVRDVLNLGVDPVFLLETLKNRFLQSGGQLLEQTPFQTVVVHPDGVTVGSARGKLLLDAMGHFSPIVRQARQGQRPDGVCLVVGTCAQGFPLQQSGDLLVAFTPIQNRCQYFWEAFPARDGRTTYLFTYLDAHPDRPSLEDLFEEYWRLLPEYQGIELSQLQWKRALFGLFPCYRRSPLQPQWDRILQVGDSSGNQSPLSFGGFGAMMRHLQRLTEGIDAALQTSQLDRQSLGLLQPYQPNLSVTWLFQRAMSVGVQQQVAPEQINQLLTAVFQVMQRSGDAVLKPFLQDVVQFPALTQTLLKVALADPALVARIIPHVGLPALLDWTVHYLNLGLYQGLSALGASLQSRIQALEPKQRYRYQRWIQSWIYGSGNDFVE